VIVSIDKLGRMVIPKEFRDSLRLTPGANLELTLVDGKLQLEVPTTGAEFEITPEGICVLTNTQLAAGITDPIAWNREQRDAEILGMSLV
jgi:AbrB family looped-hinge helix DNA binding protein